MAGLSFAYPLRDLLAAVAGVALRLSERGILFFLGAMVVQGCLGDKVSTSGFLNRGLE